MANRRYDQLDTLRKSLVDDMFDASIKVLKNDGGFRPRYDDIAERLIDALTEYILQCEEK